MVKRVQCEFCGKKLLGNQYLRVHKNKIHNELIEESYFLPSILPKK